MAYVRLEKAIHDLAKDSRLHCFGLFGHIAEVLEYTMIAGLRFVKVRRIPIQWEAFKVRIDEISTFLGQHIGKDEINAAHHQIIRCDQIERCCWLLILGTQKEAPTDVVQFDIRAFNTETNQSLRTTSTRSKRDLSFFYLNFECFFSLGGQINNCSMMTRYFL